MPALPPSKIFPPAESADEYGLVCIGGDLSPELLLDAYSHGLFPWPLIHGLEEPQWWSPDPRAIFELDSFHISRSLARTLRSGKFRVTSDRDFNGVILGCATSGDRQGQTWLSDEMIAAYTTLHERGSAHSVEVWQGDRLVGGTYGVAINGMFAAESMFFRERDASKVALAKLVEHLANRGFQLLDIQQLTSHTASLGAIEIPRQEYLFRLAEATVQEVSFGEISNQTFD
jgi:leucyl/phenylalanyl-tRNA---protein transferase